MNNYINFSERDQICHTLVEATLFRQSSVDFIDLLLTNLQKYRNQKGCDMIIDILFIKYLKSINNISSNAEMKRYINSFKNKQKITSQYHIGFLCLMNSNKHFNLRSIIKAQSLKLIRNENISINGINISTVISYYVLKKCFKFKNKININSNQNFDDYDSSNDVLLKEINITSDIPMYISKNYNSNNQEKNDIKIQYDKFKKNPNSYYPLDFWRSVSAYSYVDNYIINVDDNPYLFNAGANLSYLNRLIKVNFDVSKLKFPEKITFDLYQLLFFKLDPQQLLEFKPYSHEVKNLCSFIYLLFLENKKMSDLQVYQNSMNPNSYMILCFIYQKYTKESRRFPFNNEIDFQNPDDFIKLIYLKLKYGLNFDENVLFVNNKIQLPLLYISKNLSLRYSSESKSPENYGLLKKVLMKTNYYVYDRIDEKFRVDFIRFVGIAVKFLNGKKKNDALQYITLSNSNSSSQIEFIFSYIDSSEFENAVSILNRIKPSKEMEDALKSPEKLTKIKILLKKVTGEKAFKIIKKFNLENILSNDEKLSIYFNKAFQEVKFRISREYMLNDSFCYFLDNNMNNKIINITYNDELASDEGGLSRDWFTNVSKEIINTGIFIPTPNGDTLTFNHQKEDLMLYHFTGQFIAAAFNNRRNVNIKLASYIWKQMLGEEVTLEDLNQFDKNIYESMKWILENDPSLLEMTFVDADENELCKNGADIEVTNDNKGEFVRLIIEKKLIKENLETLEYIVNGFKEVIDSEFISLFKAKNIQEIVNGVELIDIKDWKENTLYDQKYKKQFNDFFKIISKWSQENLKKLIMFATGSSTIPFGGFKNLENSGGLFRLDFCENSMNLPTSHTCFNKIEIPCYQSIEIFEEKLLLAIECDSFGFG